MHGGGPLSCAGASGRPASGAAHGGASPHATQARAINVSGDSWAVLVVADVDAHVRRRSDAGSAAKMARVSSEKPTVAHGA